LDLRGVFCRQSAKMYIGPWQEYKLSSQSRHHATLSKDIEKAITASLDPESAERALAALNPLLHSRNNQLQRPTRPNGINQLPKRLPRRRYASNTNLPTIDYPPNYHLSTPTTLTYSARDSSDQSPVISYRSTQSEPTYGRTRVDSPFSQNNNEQKFNF